ncbi:hypothetical protein O1157_03810 [Streptomyces albogriseolus]
MNRPPFLAVIDIEHIDAYPWTPIPPHNGEDDMLDHWDDIHGWCREEAEDLWSDRELDPGPNGVDIVAGTLARCAEAFSLSVRTTGCSFTATIRWTCRFPCWPRSGPPRARVRRRCAP